MVEPDIKELLTALHHVSIYFFNPNISGVDVVNGNSVGTCYVKLFTLVTLVILMMQQKCCFMQLYCCHAAPNPLKLNIV